MEIPSDFVIIIYSYLWLCWQSVIDRYGVEIRSVFILYLVLDHVAYLLF
jgi:hypothetical protein